MSMYVFYVMMGLLAGVGVYGIYVIGDSLLRRASYRKLAREYSTKK